MALPGEMTMQVRQGMVTAASLLFERLPDKLFAPLASLNRYRYWALLCLLYERRFGPDAPLPPGNGFAIREIVQDIEDVLLTQDIWENEDGQAPDTPPSVRAYAVFNRLVETGWFRMDTFRLEKRITMSPTVGKFLTVMISFAETGPVFVSGKIRSIDINIQQVLEGKAEGDTLAETAEQARNLLEHVRNTGTTVRDIMEELSRETATAQYVRMFFSQYIEHVFIGDYRELRTREHPLSRRPQILRAVEELQQSDYHRTRLITWYESKRCSGDRKRAEQLFEKDIQRLLDLRRIDDYLDRLDDEIRRANRRALAYLEYRLRSLQPVDAQIKKIIEAIGQGPMPERGDPFPPDALVSGEGLAEPRKHLDRPPPSNLRRNLPTEGEIARSRVMLRARNARSITAPKLAQYVSEHIGSDGRVAHDALKLDSVSAIRSYQLLSSLGMAMSSGSRRLLMSAMTLARGFRVRQEDTTEIDHQGITGRPFTVEATVRAVVHSEKNHE